MIKTTEKQQKKREKYINYIGKIISRATAIMQKNFETSKFNQICYKNENNNRSELF